MSLPLKKIIYSLYVDIPEKELDEQPPHHDSNISKTLHTKLEFQKHYEWLKERHESYAKSIGVEYILFEYDKELEEYTNSMPPEITAYNALNFYKIKKLYDLSKEYDVPIVHLESELIDGWRWHLYHTAAGLWDCSHFCQDNEVWDIFHHGLVTAEETHLDNEAEDIF